MEIISQDYQETLDTLAYKLTVGRRLAEVVVEETVVPPGPPPELKLFDDEDED